MIVLYGGGNVYMTMFSYYYEQVNGSTAFAAGYANAYSDRFLVQMSRCYCNI